MNLSTLLPAARAMFGRAKASPAVAEATPCTNDLLFTASSFRWTRPDPAVYPANSKERASLGPTPAYEAAAVSPSATAAIGDSVSGSRPR